MLSFPEYDQLDGLGMADLVRRGQLTAAELCQAAIARAEAVNPQVNAIILSLFERAAAGLAAGPFGGVPFLLKDFGLPTRACPTRAAAAPCATTCPPRMPSSPLAGGGPQHPGQNQHPRVCPDGRH